MTVSLFQDLPVYTRDQVRQWNWAIRFLADGGSWPDHVREALSGLLYTRGPMTLRLTEVDGSDPTSAPKVHTFEKRDEIKFGRAPENDLIIANKMAARQHARLFIDRGQCFLEDLGSQLGTYLDGKRIPPNQPHLAKHSDHFVIFPSKFTLAIEQTWIPETNAQLQAGRLEQTTWKAFQTDSLSGSVNFEIQVHPLSQCFHVSLDRRFLESLTARILREDHFPGTARADRGMLDFLLLSLARKVSAFMPFPFQFGLHVADAAYKPDESGLLLRYTIGLTGVAGAGRLFLPNALLAAMSAAAKPAATCPGVDRVSWLCKAQLAEASVSMAELKSVERGDVLLCRPSPALILPAEDSTERGWFLTPAAERPWRFKVESDFNRSSFMDGNASESFDSGSLPVRIQVVLSEVRLTLAQLTQLRQGGILELESSKGDPVKLFVNGAPFGSGELVDVEGSLGVRLTAWGEL